MEKLRGYVRKDGSVGFRNHVLILPTVSCSAKTAQKIAYSVDGCVVAHHNEGCGHLGEDYVQVMRTLANNATNPNVAAVLLLGLGCEKTSPYELKEIIEAAGKPVEMILIQDFGTSETITRGIEIAKKMVEEAKKNVRVDVPLSSVVHGLECGGSDFTSGLAANPVLGETSDLIVEGGGTVILSEVTELIGADNVFEGRIKDEIVQRKFTEKLNLMIAESAKNLRAHVDGLDMPNCISPGNVRGGLTTIEEKALGAAVKGGTSMVVDVLDYSERVTEKGLNIMYSPGYDIESVVGMVGSGANIVIFTSGAGTPTGNPIVPVIKITGNYLTNEKMRENIDYCASKVLTGEKSIAESGRELLSLLIQIANGKECKAEIAGQDDFSIWNIGMKL